MNPLVEAGGLAIGYPGRAVGRDIDLAVAAGEVLCLLGPNGSGKTTLFRTLLGLLPAQGGTVRLGGDPLDRMPRPEIGRRAAYVPQSHAPVFPFSAHEVVLMGRTARLGLFAQPGAADRQAADDALAAVGLAERAGSPYTDLSGGQRQLVLIARALAQAAPLLVMDEPTASLDFGNQALVLTEIRRLADRGLGIVLSTHDPDHAFAVGDRVALLQDGRIRGLGAPPEVLTDAALSAVYGVPVSVETLASGRRVCVPALAEPGTG